MERFMGRMPKNKKLCHYKDNTPSFEIYFRDNLIVCPMTLSFFPRIQKISFTALQPKNLGIGFSPDVLQFCKVKKWLKSVL